MIYTFKDYAATVAKCHLNTVMYRVKHDLLPSNHIVISKGGRNCMINIVSPHEYKAGQYYDACCEFHRRKKQFSEPIELAAELSVKYEILLTKLCKMLGL